MTYTCRNCDQQVSRAYFRVFAPPELEEEQEVRCCPGCDKLREQGSIRNARSAGGDRHDGGEVNV